MFQYYTSELWKGVCLTKAFLNEYGPPGSKRGSVLITKLKISNEEERRASNHDILRKLRSRHSDVLLLPLRKLPEQVNEIRQN
jgi:hypothetical protein